MTYFAINKCEEKPFENNAILMNVYVISFKFLGQLIPRNIQYVKFMTLR